MANSGTLVLILAQLLAAVLLAAVFLGLMLWRVRQRYRRLLSAYASLKHQSDEHNNPPPEGADRAEPVKRIDWPALEAEALTRYQNFSEKSLGDYAADDPFSARIASIRYHYLQAERQAEQQHTEHERWQVLEKALAKVVSDIASSTGAIEAHEPDKVSLLRERMKTLQHVEQDNAELRGQNQRYDEELKKLRQYYQKYRALLADRAKDDAADEAQARDQADDKALRLSRANAEQRQVVGEMHSHINSDTHGELYRERDGVHQQVDALQEGVEDVDQTLEQLHKSLHHDAELDKLTVIDSLRSNNHRQRNTIASLHRELSELQHSLEHDEHDKKGQTEALERMLHECEGCIATLESEVAYLQGLLEQAPESSDTPSSAAPVLPDNTLAETLLAFALAVPDKHNPDEVIALLADTLVQLNLPYLAVVSFAQETAFGGSANLDNTTQRQRLLDIAEVSVQEHNAEGLFFSRPCLQVFVPEVALADIDFQELICLLDVMHSLIVLQLAQQGTREQLQAHHQQVLTLEQKIRAGITNIDIQYAYQTEEVKRISASLLTELDELLLGLDTNDEMREVFSNVLAEAQQRFALLHEAGSVIDNEFTRLSNALEALEKQ
ncbi:hypothetical protein [Gilvimarinus agarilyticus]|uniref:hypothetical protein n=1 Tax=Gilvimarinus agarilyticus TaxID=679259 RepID=UPI0005A09E1D|nr:hypothetical protein [Gilvimarinus agarilyticus]